MGNSNHKTTENADGATTPDVSYAGVGVGVVVIVIGVLMLKSADSDFNGIGVKGIIASALIAAPAVYAVRILMIKLRPTVVVETKAYIVMVLLLSCIAIAIYSSGVVVFIAAGGGLISAGVLIKFYRDFGAGVRGTEQATVPKSPPTVAAPPPQQYPQPLFQGYPHPGNYYHNNPVSHNAMG